MGNKIIIGLLVFLLMAAGGLGGYSAYLNRQLSDATSDIASLETKLDTELAVLRQKTSAEFDEVKEDLGTIDSELTSFEEETASVFSGVQGSLSTLDSELNSLGGRLATFRSETASRIGDVAASLSQSTIDVQSIYADVRQSVCEITDGELSLGSGFVYGEDGHVITAQHVIEGLKQIDIVLHDGAISSASVVGENIHSDVAVLRLEKSLSLTPLEFADSTAVIPGQPVIALGNPFDLPGTVTAGIVSQTNRAGNYAGDWLTTNLIQYDAASNFGNSGGAVVNGEGKLIGMTVAQIDPQISSGIYWAVSANKVKRVADSIIETGSFIEPVLPGDWMISDLTPEVAGERNLETTNGALFDEAEGIEGAEASDIIVAVDGRMVNQASDLFNYFSLYKSPGDTVTLALITHDDIETEVTVELIEGWVRME
jgi:S1-C subfamily serine protease